MNKTPTYEELQQRVDSLEAELLNSRQIEQSLKEESIFQRILFDHSPDGVLIIDPPTARFIEFNTAAHQQLGYTREEFSLLSIFDIEATETVAETHARIAGVLENGKSDFETRHRTRQGEIRNVHVTAQIVNVQGKSVYHCVWRDITEYKRVEEKLQASQQLFANIIEFLPDPTFVVDLENRPIAWNRAMEEMTGYRKEDVVGKKDDNGTIPFYGKRRGRLIDLIDRDDKELESRYTYVRRKGDTLYAEAFAPALYEGNGAYLWAIATPLLDVQGRRAGFIESVRDITTLKQTQQELLSKNALMESLLESTIDGILVVNNLGQKLLLNQRFREMWHFPPDILDDVNDSRQLQYFASITKSPTKFLERVYYLYSHPNETSRDEIEFVDGMVVDRYSAPVLGKDGTYYGRIWVFRDITERKRAEERLIESQQKLADIIDFLPDATFVINQEGTVIAWNRAIEEMTGLKAIDMVGKGDYEYALAFYNEKRPILIDLVLAAQHEQEAKYSNLVRRESVLEGESYLPSFNGHEAYLTGKASVLRDSKGHVVGAIESIRNITDYRHAEGKYRDIFENAVMGIYQVLPDGRLISANPAMARMLGYDSPEELMSTVTDLGPHLYGRPELHFEYQRIMDERGGHLEDETQFIRKDGSSIWVALTAQAVRDKSGKLVCYQGSIMDITERKILENQLRQSQKMEAIGTLAGGIAHDFNNILSAVLGYTEMALRERSIDDRLRLYIERIYKAGLQAAELVKQILTFSRQSEEKLYPLRVSPVIKEVLKLLRASIPTTIEIRQQLQTDPDVVLGNPSYIHQILMNLCTNASQAMRERKGVLRVGLMPVAIANDDPLSSRGLTPGMHLKLTVSDTGEGIAPEIMDKIFDPFFTTKKPGEGTGMGLSVVHGIVKRCGGVVTAQSEPGKGSEFNVYFPLLVETSEGGQKEGKVDIVGGTERILYVDDDEIIAQLGIGMLSFLGYRVVSKTNSSEALELFRNDPGAFDLVVTDMTMPNMTGVELAQELLRLRPGLPVILCTGFSETITPDNAKQYGLREVIMKPIILDQLAAAIRRELDQKS